jgi:endonuclease G, mitochondrial
MLLTIHLHDGMAGCIHQKTKISFYIYFDGMHIFVIPKLLFMRYSLLKSLLFLLLTLLLLNSHAQQFNGCEECKYVNKSIHTTLGIPQDDTPDDDYLVCREQYVLSYNPLLNTANWVSWNLNQTYFGDAARFSGKFRTDPLLPSGFTKITHDDYTNSGFDRGHIVRSEERTANPADNITTFFLTNILPQQPDLNQGVWLSLEYYCEKNLCMKYDKELFVIAGGIFSNNPRKLNNKVAVPDSCYKIIVILDRGKSLKDVSAKTEVIAVAMPNRAGVRKHKWTQYLTTVDAIEKSTGYDFLSAVPESIQSIIESRVISVRYD